MDPSPLIAWSCWIATIILVAGIVLAFIRLLRGPTLPDRVIALDVIATMAIGALALVSISTGQAVLIDVALSIAIITFLGTVALAMSIEKGVFK